MTTRTIELSPEASAYYSGVAAGDEVLEAISADPLFTDKPHHVRHGWYWLQVGLRLAAANFSTQELVSQFILGASLRQPSRHGLTIHIDTRHPAFEAPEGTPDADVDTHVEHKLGIILSRVADDVFNGASGDSVITTIDGIVVGHLTVTD